MQWIRQKMASEKINLYVTQIVHEPELEENLSEMEHEMSHEMMKFKKK